MTAEFSWRHTPARLDETASMVWNAVAAAGVLGINHLALMERTGLDRAPLKRILHTLRRHGHLAFKGHTRHGVWTATHNIPPGEHTPLWIREGQTADDGISRQASEAQAQEIADAVARAPNSVFDMGTKAAAADAAEPEPEPEPEPAPIAATGPAAPLMVREFLVCGAANQFALCSSGVLRIETPHHLITLDADTTRGLFAYLDNLARIGQEGCLGTAVHA